LVKILKKTLTVKEYKGACKMISGGYRALSEEPVHFHEKLTKKIQSWARKVAADVSINYKTLKKVRLSLDPKEDRFQSLQAPDPYDTSGDEDEETKQKRVNILEKHLNVRKTVFFGCVACWGVNCSVLM
jgi:hypothetical protein